MPLPKPNNGETKDEFIERCMGNETMVEDYPENDQRYAVCQSQWGKKSAGPIMERRTFNAELRLETQSENKGRKIIGHAAVFDTIAGNGWFKEKVAPGAFVNSIKEDDVRALFNHDPNFVLGRNKAGTLAMREDDKGLLVEIDPPDTQFARDLSVSIERGDITQMSFGFEILKEEREQGDGKEPDLFTLREVKLWDVSPVTFPFYSETDVSVHSRQAWRETQRIVKAFEARGFRVRWRKLNEKVKHYQRRWK